MIAGVPGELLPALLPELVTAGGALILFFLARLRWTASKTGDLALLVCAGSAAAAVLARNSATATVLGGLLAVDPASAFFRFLLSLTAMAVVWMATRSREEGPAPQAMDWSLFLGSLLAMQIAIGANHFGVLWAASCGGALASARWLSLSGRDAAVAGWSLEASLLGSAASAWMLLGVALLAGFSGTLEYAAAASRFSVALAAPGGKAVMLVGLALLFFGMGQSVSIVPWASSRVRTTGGVGVATGAWFAVGGIIAGVAATSRLVRALCEVSQEGVWTTLPGVEWPALLGVLALVSMTVANVAALRETDLKRLLAWWSVVQGSLAWLGLSTLRDRGLEASLAHLAIYATTMLGALAILAPLVEQRGSSRLEVLRGLARESGGARVVAVVLAVFLLSLAGVAPLGGFEGRAELIAAVFESSSLGTASVVAMNSALGLLCCTRLLVLMLDAPQPLAQSLKLDFEAVVLVMLLLAAVVGFGLWPSTLAAFAHHSAVFFTD